VIKALNPVAEVIYARQGDVPLKKILGTGRFDLDRASRMAGWFKELAGEHTPETEEFGISSFVLRLPEPMHPRRFAAFLEKPLSGVLRAKGFIWLASRPEWAISYSRCGNVATVEPVGRWWAAVPREHWPAKGSAERDSIEQAWRTPYGDRVNEVVFIVSQSEIRSGKQSSRHSKHVNLDPPKSVGVLITGAICRTIFQNGCP
jgi:G3E family GTPase